MKSKMSCGDFLHRLDEFRLARIAALDALDEAFQIDMFLGHWSFLAVLCWKMNHEWMTASRAAARSASENAW